ncbi:MAG: 30S ribosomal protein S7 [Flavobacteriales bacterium]
MQGAAKVKGTRPDPKYGDENVTVFVNNLMIDGKKDKAFNIFYDALKKVKEKTNEDELEVFKTALTNVGPLVEVRSRRVGGATFQIPQEVPPNRKMSLAMKWLIRFSRNRQEKTIQDNLAAELIAAYNEEGGAYKKKQETHKMAEANKAFSHFKF